jgi:EAL and modified HD-GYP domain-containing signal transduction protein
MDLFLARQPIFDLHMHVCAYEMLYRSSWLNEFDGTEDSAATAKVIGNLVASAEGEALLAGKTAYINFPRALLLNETGFLLSPQRTVIEILETVEPDEEVIQACSGLRARGYRLALDDFVPTSESHPLIPLADILKVDFRATDKAQQQATAMRFRGQLRLLAEKVETREEYRRAATIGYEYFQGYFFARPVVSSTRQIPGFKLNYLRILQELHHTELDFNRLTQLLKRETALSYQLLRFVNSALFTHRVPIESIHQALMFIGEDAAKKWLAVVALIDLTCDQPTELMVNALVRARFAELLARHVGLLRKSEDCFLMGLFSRLDAMLSRPLEELLHGLNLDAEISRALLDRPLPGDRLSVLWKLVEAHENADWQHVVELASNLRITPATLAAGYQEAAQWADTACHG